jgi:hypothetical protein
MIFFEKLYVSPIVCTLHGWFYEGFVINDLISSESFGLRFLTQRAPWTRKVRRDLVKI